MKVQPLSCLTTFPSSSSPLSGAPFIQHFQNSLRNCSPCRRPSIESCFAFSTENNLDLLPNPLSSIPHRQPPTHHHRPPTTTTTTSAAQNRFKCKQGNLVIPPNGATYKTPITRDHCHLLPYGDEKYCFIEECIWNSRSTSFHPLITHPNDTQMWWHVWLSVVKDRRFMDRYRNDVPECFITNSVTWFIYERTSSMLACLAHMVCVNVTMRFATL